MGKKITMNEELLIVAITPDKYIRKLAESLASELARLKATIKEVDTLIERHEFCVCWHYAYPIKGHADWCPFKKLKGAIE